MLDTLINLPVPNTSTQQRKSTNPIYTVGKNINWKLSFTAPQHTSLHRHQTFSLAHYNHISLSSRQAYLSCLRILLSRRFNGSTNISVKWLAGIKCAKLSLFSHSFSWHMHDVLKSKLFWKSRKPQSSMKIRLYIHITVNTIAKYFVYYTGSKQLISTRMIDVKVCIRPKYAFFLYLLQICRPPS